jgi:hypothetical protein
MGQMGGREGMCALLGIDAPCTCNTSSPLVSVLTATLTLTPAASSTA